MSNNFETVRDTRNMSKNDNYETEVALSDSGNKYCVNRPLEEDWRWRHIRLTIKPRYLWNHASQIRSYYGMLSGITVALSQSIMKNRMKRPLTEKSRWRHIRFAIKTPYLGNHASQIKSYYRTLSWSLSNSYKKKAANINFKKLISL